MICGSGVFSVMTGGHPRVTESVAAPDMAVERQSAPAPAPALDQRRRVVRRLRRAIFEIQLDDSRPIVEREPGVVTRRRDALYRRLLAVADVFAAGLAVNLAILAGGARPTAYVLLALPLIVVLGKLLGLYDRDEYLLHKTTLDEAPKLLQVSLLFLVFAWLFDNQLATAWLGKPELLLMAALLLVYMGLTRTLARRVASRRTTPERLLVLGSSCESERVREKLASVAPVNAELVGRVPIAHEPKSARGEDVLGILPELDYVLKREHVDRVLICPPGDLSGELLDTIRLVKELGVKVSVMPRLFEVVGSAVEFDEVGGLMFLGLRRYELSRSSALMKRALDLTGAAVGLVLLSPLLGAIALGVKLTSPGPVFFRQPRVGRGGASFDMLKFRTMYDGADDLKDELRHRNETDGFFKIAEDPRCTPIGRLLRRMSLDEMPQLINVLRGEMSLVGPRPLVHEEDKRIEGWFRRRLDVTPGMTGAWQVLGSSRVPMRDMVTIDYLYRTNWSLWLDVKILLRTVPHMLNRRGL
jgi:exopolysaccharide biosynthesis polyprenyl glycosylphosphotransferase